ncbi:uncharacterized protein LOC127717853 [Mytilus californianus]|uniref:uncharacterized protein LOC127717853 n=1 Tax=Mytilus californianus TaxID=6549 RepID=UPI002246E096|nr:uncharacterized protein LOC127717853 [Mytilus californianus]
MYRKRMITSKNIQTPEVNGDESAHYAEIIQTDDILDTGQGNNDQSIALADRIRVVVKNRDITNVPEDHFSTISDNDANGSDILDDGYEKPYSTLMEIDRDDYEHVYLSVRNNLTNENSTFLENTASGNSSGFTEVHYIPDKTKSFSYRMTF